MSFHLVPISLMYILCFFYLPALFGIVSMKHSGTAGKEFMAPNQAENHFMTLKQAVMAWTIADPCSCYSVLGFFFFHGKQV